MSARDPGLAFTDGALQFELWADKLWDPMGRRVAEAAVLQPAHTDRVDSTPSVTVNRPPPLGPAPLGFGEMFVVGHDPYGIGVFG